jgi:Cu/Ag efflux pump CusA
MPFSGCGSRAAERERLPALGLFSLAIGSGEAGREIEGPMAIVILGGLLTSTVLDLLVLPTLALRDGRFERPSVSVG